MHKREMQKMKYKSKDEAIKAINAATDPKEKERLKKELQKGVNG